MSCSHLVAERGRFCVPQRAILRLADGLRSPYPCADAL